MDTIQHLGNFAVVELRRYAIRPGERENFALYFESYFPEAFEQLGALALGQFFERAKDDHFTWLRGYHDLDARARCCAEFYFGPLWKEHKATLNGLLLDNDDVLLLRPARPETAVSVLPAVDVVREPDGAQGVAVAQIFGVHTGQEEEFARQAEPGFAGYRAAGAREAGVLSTLDVPNNFPQHPIRTDGPFVVWLGIVPDNASLARLEPLAQAVARSEDLRQLLRGEPEWVVLDPSRRSRLRWRS